ncbi:MAG: hypothetical protein JOS17DRAFT_766392, partial [Linnemannia elongata]
MFLLILHTDTIITNRIARPSLRPRGYDCLLTLATCPPKTSEDTPIAGSSVGLQFGSPRNCTKATHAHGKWTRRSVTATSKRFKFVLAIVGGYRYGCGGSLAICFYLAGGTSLPPCQDLGHGITNPFYLLALLSNAVAIIPCFFLKEVKGKKIWRERERERERERDPVLCHLLQRTSTRTNATHPEPYVGKSRVS